MRGIRGAAVKIFMHLHAVLTRMLYVHTTVEPFCSCVRWRVCQQLLYITALKARAAIKGQVEPIDLVSADIVG